MKRSSFFRSAAVSLTILALTLIASTYALADDSSSSALTIKPVATASAPKQIDYTLPYPGLLPDNPLYFLKSTRDKIIGFFISDPIKKADFDRLQADKRINMGIYLLNAHKTYLIPTIISKGENYFSEGIGQLNLAKQQGINIQEQAKLYQTAALKYTEVLVKLEAEIKDNAIKEQIQAQEKRIKGFQDDLNNIK